MPGGLWPLPAHCRLSLGLDLLQRGFPKAETAKERKFIQELEERC
jgi:hypothetical protein